MILIADSGSTKTDWAVVDDGRMVTSMATQGINPFHQDTDNIAAVIETELLPKMGDIYPEEIYFYGSGCREDKVEMMCSILGKAFPHCTRIEAQGDLLAAARAVCGANEGIACIMGTGANSCLYDGKRVVENTPPLGYILGDEGSGAVLGKLLVGDVLKKQLPEPLCEKFLKEYDLDRLEIIRRVYREPFANRFLASLSPFLAKNIEEPAVHRLVLNAFKAFFVRNITNYKNYKSLKVNFVGSIAMYYRSVLEEAAASVDCTIGTIIKSPMEGLILYHSK